MSLKNNPGAKKSPTGNNKKPTRRPETKRLKSPSPDDLYHRFSVSDNGPGIEERHFTRIFMIFQTLTPRDKFESTGIGLALVRKIIEMYGGSTWVESVVGQGSAFFFTLPKERADEKQ